MWNIAVQNVCFLNHMSFGSVVIVLGEHWEWICSEVQSNTEVASHFWDTVAVLTIVEKYGE